MFGRNKQAAISVSSGKIALVALIGSMLLPTPGYSDVNALLEEVVVTARKRSDAEALQDVPIAAAAFNSNQLDALNVRNIESLSYQMPNVSLDDAGSFKGTANFSIRGLGISATIPSIDPAVGVFVDGMYLGVNNGVVIDMFDLEGIEVLRGPQGLLFGRNVTGGAVVIKTQKPTEEFSFTARASVTHELDKVLAGSVSGPINDGLKARLSVYFNHDDGWFNNKKDDSDYGGGETVIVKPSLLWDINETSSLIVRLEHGDVDGDGTAIQNSARFDPDTFDFSNDETLSLIKWDHAIAEYNTDIAFGEGTITNILAWRDVEADATFDTDGLGNFPAIIGTFRTRQDQVSNELRYAGTFYDGKVNLTTGAFWISQDLQYLEKRGENGFGGLQEHTALGLFVQTDVGLGDALVLTLGGRYSREEKDAKVATFVVPGPCNFDTGACVFDFEDDDTWDSFTPKIGLQWFPNENTQIYAHYTKGFRSGNYNMRHTAAGFAPGPVDQEEVDSYEIGTKAEWFNGKLRTNLAVFRNEIGDMQREVNLPAPPPLNNIQLIQNTADATIDGFELEVIASLTDSFLVTAHYGYLDSTYDKILFDISGDGVIDDTDFNLDIPRLAPNTYGISLNHELEIGGIGYLSSRVSFNHRDEAAFTDNNRGLLPGADMIGANISLTLLDERITLSLFGKNLKNEVTYGVSLPLPPAPVFGGLGATLQTLGTGRIYGFEVRYEL